ncbi:MAG: UbiA family prenyltransferase, partial [Gemmatimonadota bacterium]|nr:UbiA family prenyltransferase [Gemmatimonadota bacterium]
MSEAATPVPSAARTLTRDFLTLTKPRIISLLLVTTVAPMYVAGRPSVWLVLVLLAGGYLMAGGANAVNMYLDSDIDDRMSRTRLRPIPSGRMHPREVLVFGLILATGATFLLARYANLLTAALALLGFYAYILLYTRWLKRSTPQNIVIGGAAECVAGAGAAGGRVSDGRRCERGEHVSGQRHRRPDVADA